MFVGLYLLFTVRDLHMSTALGGTIIYRRRSGQSVRRFGLGRTLIGASVAMGVANLPGRVSSALHLLFRGVIPVGAILGGLLAGRIGGRQTMWLKLRASSLSNAWLFFSPTRCLRKIPVNP
jgi:hypothetical protein